MKKINTMILLVALIFCTAMPSASAETIFDDVKSTSWAAESIHYLVEKGAVEGIGHHRFNPNGYLTRGQASKIIALSLDLDMDRKEKTDFRDARDHWASPYIRAIEKEGIINGFPNGTFDPNGFITREQMAKMIVHAYDLVRADHATVHFEDVSGWAEEYIHILASLRVIEGTSSTRFDPKGKVTRAQAAAIIHRVEVPIIFPFP